MAWTITAYAATAMCLVIAAAAWLALILWRRTMIRLGDAALKLNERAETAFGEWHKLAKDASEAASACRRIAESGASLAAGGKALGDATGKAAQAAADVAEAWSARLNGHLASDADWQANMIGRTLDWSELGIQLWQSWRRRLSRSDEEASAPASKPVPRPSEAKPPKA